MQQQSRRNLGEQSAATGTPVARRYHVHSALVLYCLVALLMSIGAFNSNNNLLFWLFFLSLSMILVSGFISGAMLMAVRVERMPLAEVQAAVETPEGTQGGLTLIRYRVTNSSRWAPLFAVTISESGLASATRAAPLTLAVGSPPPAQGQLASMPTAFLAHAPAGGSVEIEAAVVATRRGLIALREITLVSEFPFGIVRKSLRFSQPATLVVRPAPRPLSDSALEAVLDPEPGADSSERRIGHGEQFFSLREYSPGDSPRAIAWRASSRQPSSSEVIATGPGGIGASSGLLVRQTATPRSKRLAVVLDLSHAASDAAYERAISVAAGVISAERSRGTRLQLAVQLQGEAAPRALSRYGWASESAEALRPEEALSMLAALPGFAGEHATARGRTESLPSTAPSSSDARDDQQADEPTVSRVAAPGASPATLLIAAAGVRSSRAGGAA